MSALEKKLARDVAKLRRVLKAQVASGLPTLTSSAMADQLAAIAKLEALVPHPGDGSCDKCGAAPAVHVPMSLCRECYGTEKRIARLEERLSHAIEVIVAHHTRGHPTACVCGMCLCVCDLRSALKEGE